MRWITQEEMNQQKRRRGFPVEDNGNPMGFPFTDPLGLVCWLGGTLLVAAMAVVGWWIYL